MQAAIKQGVHPSRDNPKDEGSNERSLRGKKEESNAGLWGATRHSRGETVRLVADMREEHLQGWFLAYETGSRGQHETSLVGYGGHPF